MTKKRDTEEMRQSESEIERKRGLVKEILLDVTSLSFNSTSFLNNLI